MLVINGLMNLTLLLERLVSAAEPLLLSFDNDLGLVSEYNQNKINYVVSKDFYLIANVNFAISRNFNFNLFYKPFIISKSSINQDENFSLKFLNFSYNEKVPKIMPAEIVDKYEKFTKRNQNIFYLYKAANYKFDRFSFAINNYKKTKNLIDKLKLQHSIKNFKFFRHELLICKPEIVSTKFSNFLIQFIKQIIE